MKIVKEHINEIKKNIDIYNGLDVGKIKLIKGYNYLKHNNLIKWQLDEFLDKRILFNRTGQIEAEDTEKFLLEIINKNIKLQYNNICVATKLNTDDILKFRSEAGERSESRSIYYTNELDSIVYYYKKFNAYEIVIRSTYSGGAFPIFHMICAVK